MKKSPVVKDEVQEAAIVDYQDKYQRALADYQNLLKQTAKDKIDMIKYGNERLLNELLPVYDFLKLSLAHSNDGDALAGGLKHVLQEFKKVLTGVGVTDIVTLDQPFDVKTMEAVETVETTDERLNDIVAKELQSGYSLFDKVIRPARVAVYKQAINPFNDNLSA